MPTIWPVSLSTTQVTGTWTSNISTSIGTFASVNASLMTVSQLSVSRFLGTCLGQDGAALAPADAFSSETSLGFYRSANSTLRVSYGTFWPVTIWVDSGLSMIGSTASVSGLNVASTASTAGLNVSSTGTLASLYVTSTISCSGLTVSSIATVSRLSSLVSVLATALWGSGLSIGNATAGGTLIPGISSISSKMPITVVQASGSSLYTVTWTGVQAGDQILDTTYASTVASAVSAGLIVQSTCTIANRFEVRFTNTTPSIVTQSAQTWAFTRVTPF